MGHRLSRIYTKTGDDGTTGLGDGTRVAAIYVGLVAIAHVGVEQLARLGHQKASR